MFRALAVAVVLAGCAAEKSGGEPNVSAPGSSNGAIAPAATTATTPTAPLVEPGAPPPPPPPPSPPSDFTKKGHGSLTGGGGGDANDPTGVAEDPCAGGKVIDSSGRIGAGSGAAATGKLDATAISRVILASKAPLHRCYNDALARDPKVGHVKIVVKFTIGTTGDTANVAPTGGDAKLRDCVAAVFRALHFPPSSEPSNVSFPLVYDSE